MIAKQKKSKQDTRHNKTQTVSIQFLDSAAEIVAIAGSFNDWRHEVTPMVCMGEGRWAKNLALPPGRYEYCLVIDGCKWIPDPAAKEFIPNPFGTHNSVLRVSESA